MQVEVGRKGEGYVATPSPFMVTKGHSEAPPFVPLQQGMVTKRGDENGRAGRIFMVPDLQLERGAGSVLEHNHANKIRNSVPSRANSYRQNVTLRFLQSTEKPKKYKSLSSIQHSR